jgi:hypothetical protein
MAVTRKNPMTAQGTQHNDQNRLNVKHNDQNRLNVTDFGGEMSALHGGCPLTPSIEDSLYS